MAELFERFDFSRVLEDSSIYYAFKELMKLILAFVAKELEADALPP